MKQGSTIDALVDEVERQTRSKQDYVADTRKMQFATTRVTSEATVPSSALLLDISKDDGGLGEFVISDHAHGQVASRVKIPKRYYDRMRAEAPELLDRNVNHWFNEQPEKRMIRTLDGRARAFVSDRYHRIDNHDIFSVAYPIIRESGAVVVSCELTELRMYLKVAWPEIQQTIDTPKKVGDVITAGMLFQNSEVGAGSFVIAPYTTVLSCLNGMTHIDYGTRKIHLGSAVEEGTLVNFADDTMRAQDEAFRLGVRDMVTQVASQESFNRLVDDLRHLPEFKVEGSPAGVVEKLAQKHDLTDDEKGGVLRHLIEGADLSAWGYLNAVTRTAEDADSYDRASDLEALGGALAAQSEREWSALAA